MKSFWQRKRVKTCAKMQRWRVLSATQLGKLVRDKFKPHIKE